jgi:hydrogenase nickel incorporation protein HypA/HybF
MHELAITESILNQAIAEAGKQGATRIILIKVLIGEATSVVPDCLHFYFDDLRQGTPADGARLEIETVPVRLRCRQCHEDVAAFTPACACAAGVEYVSGQELLIDCIEVE